MWMKALQLQRTERPHPKMYCFCTARMPIRAILAISEDVVGTKEK